MQATERSRSASEKASRLRAEAGRILDGLTSGNLYRLSPETRAVAHENVRELLAQARDYEAIAGAHEKTVAAEMKDAAKLLGELQKIQTRLNEQGENQIRNLVTRDVLERQRFALRAIADSIPSIIRQTAHKSGARREEARNQLEVFFKALAAERNVQLTKEQLEQKVNLFLRLDPSAQVATISQARRELGLEETSPELESLMGR
jgi:hypothetical protein